MIRQCVGELVSHALGKIGKLADGQGNVSRVMCHTFYMPTLSEQMHDSIVSYVLE